ncbi:MAG: hypothetical protein SGPRY_012526, partial [Prymnesium sp.]
VHKHNSLDHYKLARSRQRASSRPQSAAPPSRRHPPLHRPQTAARMGPSRPVVPPKRPQSAQARLPSVGHKTALQAAIDGDTGPPMTGVTTYPYSRLEAPYINDFRAVVANTRCAQLPQSREAPTLECSAQALRMRAGSNFDEGKLAGITRWKTECARAFVAKSYEQAVRAHANGLRSEEMMFVG